MQQYRYLLLLALVCLPCMTTGLVAAERAQMQGSEYKAVQEAVTPEKENQRPSLKRHYYSQEHASLRSEEARVLKTNEMQNSTEQQGSQASQSGNKQASTQDSMNQGKAGQQGAPASQPESKPSMKDEKSSKPDSMKQGKAEQHKAQASQSGNKQASTQDSMNQGKAGQQGAPASQPESKPSMKDEKSSKPDSMKQGKAEQHKAQASQSGNKQASTQDSMNQGKAGQQGAPASQPESKPSMKDEKSPKPDSMKQGKAEQHKAQASQSGNKQASTQDSMNQGKTGQQGSQASQPESKPSMQGGQTSTQDSMNQGGSAPMHEANEKKAHDKKEHEKKEHEKKEHEKKEHEKKEHEKKEHDKAKREEMKRVERHYHHHHYSSKHTQYEVTPHLHKACHIFLTSELLYWKTKEDGWDYTFINAFGFQTPNDIYGKMHNVHADYRLGYRNGIKHEIGNSRWDLNLVWTSYHNNSNQKAFVEGNQNDVTLTYVNPNGIPAEATGALAHWKLKFNAIDFEIGYNMGWKSRFAIRPFAGIKIAKIQQTLDLLYLNEFELTPSLVNVFAQERLTSHNAGLRFGMNSQYNIGAGFKVFLNAAVASIWSHFNMQHKDVIEGHPPRSIYRRQLDRISPELELSAGIGWQKFFRERQYYLDLRLGWEEQIWLSQNQVMRTVAAGGFDQIETHEHDLSFAGPTFSATFGF